MKTLFQTIAEIYRRTAARPFFSSEMSPAKWAKLVMASSVLILALSAALTIAFDPCFRYRKPSLYPPVYSQAYDKVPGILRHFDYDSLLIGSSNAQNFRIDDFNRLMNDRQLVKATAAGMTPATMKLFFDIARKARKAELKKVYATLDTYAFCLPPDFHRHDVPDYFYSDNHLYDCGYWWNVDVFTENAVDLINVFFNRKRISWQLDPDTMFAWDNPRKRQHYGRQYVLGKIDHIDSLNFFRMERRNVTDNIERNLRPMVRDNPQISFVFFFPPPHAVFLAVLSSLGGLDRFLEVREAVVAELLRYPNVEVYDFMTAYRVVGDYRIYKDYMHYSPPINTWMVKCFARKQYRVTSADAVQANNAVLRIFADKFIADLPASRQRMRSGDVQPPPEKKSDLGRKPDDTETRTRI